MVIRFDTRNTKPKLRALALLTVISLLLVGALMVLDAEGFAPLISFQVAAYALGAILLLLWAFQEQIHYNPYSYNTVFYMGFAIFGLSVMITHAVLAAQMLSNPGQVSERALLSTLLSSAKRYMLLSTPFLLGFSVALCVSNISLIRHEGRRPVNLLGILLSFLLLGGLVLIWRFDFYASGSQKEVMVHDLIANLMAAIYLYFECMLIGVIIADAIAARYEPEKNKDFLISLINVISCHFVIL